MSSKEAYVIYLNESRPKIRAVESVKNELDAIKSKNIYDLNTNDMRLFKKNMQEAYPFWEKFVDTKEILLKKYKGKKEELFCVLCKRHYLVLALMKDKLSTTRNKLYNISRGDFFYLYDQTYFVKVQLTSVEKIGNKYKYNYKLIRQ